jgi:UDP-4-amino-4,6-dideoxy-N-acetyl-beta-L-altrosamine transaminase
MISYGRQNITQDDIDAVIDVLKSDFITQGTTVPEFENAVCSLVGARHAVAVNSATSSLHIACLALGLGQGDILWTVPNSFVASANCAFYCGAKVDFVDIDALTWNVSVQKLKEKLRTAKKNNKLPKIIVPVHFAGQPSEQELIMELAQEYGVKILEDASHALGASRGVEMVGSNKWSDISVFSFHAVKMITTGEGGMAVTNSDELAHTMNLLRSHGITRNPKYTNLGKSAPAWYYEQQLLGFNYRMTDIQAALGLSQLQRLDKFLEQRRYLANRYNKLLKELPVQLPYISKKNLSSWHLYVIRVKQDEKNPDLRRKVYDKLKKSDVGVNVHYMPIHLQPYYRELGFDEGDYSEAESHGKEAITLPLYPGLSENEQDFVVKTLKEALNC